MDQVSLESALAGLPLGDIRYFDSIGSTNDYALYWMQYGPPNLSIVVADEQTAGRGRAGRQWLTPRGTAIAVSVILHPSHMAIEQPGWINGLGALAVSDALLGLGLSATIKWPNDVLLSGNKVAGILPESQWLGEQFRGVVLGMGINVRREALPPAETLSFPAGCVEEALGQHVARESVLSKVLSSLLFWLKHLGTPLFLETWKSRLAFRREWVTIIPASGEPVEGKVIGLSPEGNLRLMVGTMEHVFTAGELRLRPSVDKNTKIPTLNLVDTGQS